MGRSNTENATTFRTLPTGGPPRRNLSGLPRPAAVRAGPDAPAVRFGLLGERLPTDAARESASGVLLDFAVPEAATNGFHSDWSTTDPRKSLGAVLRGRVRLRLENGDCGLEVADATLGRSLGRKISTIAKKTKTHPKATFSSL